MEICPLSPCARTSFGLAMCSHCSLLRIGSTNLPKAIAEMWDDSKTIAGFALFRVVKLA